MINSEAQDWHSLFLDYNTATEAVTRPTKVKGNKYQAFLSYINMSPNGVLPSSIRSYFRSNGLANIKDRYLKIVDYYIARAKKEGKIEKSGNLWRKKQEN